MARNENPWSSWVSQHVSGTFAHPDAPAGGMGFGYPELAEHLLALAGYLAHWKRAAIEHS